jgi:hypothetical protein
MITKKARKLKIKILAEGKRIWLPSLPIWLIKAAMRIILAVVKVKEAGSDKKTAVISVKDARMIIDELASYGRFVLVDVDIKDDKTRIFIELK